MSPLTTTGLGGDDEGETIQMLAVVIDLNMNSWSNLPFEQSLQHLILFLNSHLGLTYNDRLVVIASGSKSSEIVYPLPIFKSSEPVSVPSAKMNRTQSLDGSVNDGEDETVSDSNTGLTRKPANAYKQFYDLETILVSGIKNLIKRESEDTSNATRSYATISSGLSLALTYLNKANNAESGPVHMQQRIMVVSVSDDCPSQYVSLMNCIFAAQRGNICIDVCRLSPEPSSILSQASVITGGIYYKVEKPLELINHLLFIFLPDRSLRKSLLIPSQDKVDLSATCFCHRKNVDIGFVCSVCLSVFCQAYHVCPTCQTEFTTTT